MRRRRAKLRGRWRGKEGKTHGSSSGRGGAGGLAARESGGTLGRVLTVL